MNTEIAKPIVSLPSNFSSQKHLPKFWSRVVKSDKCWEWIGSKDDEGYGRMHLGNGSIKAHRLSFLIAHGTISVGMCICHTCDNPSCVNPEHLWAGTNYENQHDKLKKQREARGATHGTRTKPECVKRGVANGRSKLNPELVESIRDQYASGKISYKKLASKFNVSKTLVRKIVANTLWKIDETLAQRSRRGFCKPKATA